MPRRVSDETWSVEDAGGNVFVVGDGAQIAVVLNRGTASLRVGYMMAAAPDLYRVCLDIVDAIDLLPKAMHPALRAALDKAEGRVR